MNAQDWLQQLRQQRAIAVIRVTQLETGLQLAQAVVAGGIHCIEIAWNSQQAFELIQRLRATLPQCSIGAGTIRSAKHLEQAIAAGAEFLFMPHTCPDLIQLAIQHKVSVIPGALTPTEIVNAWQAGATCVKVFPIQAVGYAHYVQALKPVLGDIPLIPTGGVTIHTARDFIQAGAIAVGLSGDLFPASLVATQDWDAIYHRTRTLMQSLQSLN
jgi:2-dehydro-3-deoxyphosphogluconate aldolase / (4S)-4-hydroxy-2-oxoglutarate aldolase